MNLSYSTIEYIILKADIKNNSGLVSKIVQNLKIDDLLKFSGVLTENARGTPPSVLTCDKIALNIINKRLNTLLCKL